MMNLIPMVYAEEPAPPAADAPKPPGMFDMALPLLLMFVIFYFLLLRPNQKKLKQKDEFVKTLKVNDYVITTGGIVGKVTDVSDIYVTLEIATNVKIKVLRNQVNMSVAEVEKTSKPKEEKKNA